jgi:hypothetical protein
MMTKLGKQIHKRLLTVKKTRYVIDNFVAHNNSCPNCKAADTGVCPVAYRILGESCGIPKQQELFPQYG